MRVLIATLKKNDTAHVMHGVGGLVVPSGVEVEHRTFTDYDLPFVVAKAKRDGFDYLLAVDSNVIFPTTMLDALLRLKESHVFVIAPQEGVTNSFIGCHWVDVKTPGSSPRYMTSFPLMSFNDKTKVSSGNRLGMEYCVTDTSPYDFLLKDKTRTDVSVQFACPKINDKDTPVTDFGKLSRNFIALRDDDILMPSGMDVVEAYEYIFETSINRNKTHLVIIESDVMVPICAADRLLVDSVEKKNPFVCGVYPFKGGSDVCVAIERDVNGMSRRLAEPYVKRGLVPCTRATPMGCCVVDLAVVQTLEKPWFENKTIDGEDFTQDTYFTYRFTQAGYNAMVDTNIQCVHVDRITKECFGSPDLIEGRFLKESARKELAC